MSEQDESQSPRTKSEADQTLLGVAPPRVEQSVESLPRAPVYVRAGTADVDAEPLLSVRSEPPLGTPPAARHAAPSVSAPPAAQPSSAGRFFELARRRPALWMALSPVVLASVVIAIAGHSSPRFSVPETPAEASSSTPLAPSSSALPAEAQTAPPSAQKAQVTPAAVAELEARPAQSLSAQEVLLVAAARADRELLAASALRHKVESEPALGKDRATQSELLRLANDERTAHEALAGMAALEGPVSADLLYETWTSTASRSEVTELARALLYSRDVRPKASPALSVALTLRLADSCEQYRDALPSALKDGDRRSLHLLAKLSIKRGCGPKKAGDCFACLRAPGDELNATINAVKSRHAPIYGAQ